MRRSILATGLAMAAMGVGLASPHAAQPVQKQAARSESPRVTRNQKRRTLRSYFTPAMFYATHVTSTRTVAQDKRAAKKRRNKAR